VSVFGAASWAILASSGRDDGLTRELCNAIANPSFTTLVCGEKGPAVCSAALIAALDMITSASCYHVHDDANDDKRENELVGHLWQSMRYCICKGLKAQRWRLREIALCCIEAAGQHANGRELRDAAGLSEDDHARVRIRAAECAIRGMKNNLW
jgi:hypothetical protein